ncbi:hypothetical protein CIG75_12840 [Tumebacillus algifaecis]|uniref:DUF4760 domain-containing protein n=1 Tax=Tumebacillus algifaecis TaxID=1214604 RepID=A0A223D2R5_9BACL|nr:hypothetical protein [Tumebacillus algifaecis]ASS75785.1 hypothetical protein CIG75_12840 [Tumebacillus algifaecis]
MSDALIAVIITQAVVVLLFSSLHYWVEPRKEKKKHRKEVLMNFYSPVYAALVVRGKMHINAEERNGRPKPNFIRIISIEAKDEDYIDRRWIEKFIHENIGYASSELVEAWAAYVSSTTMFGKVDHKYTEALVKAIVIEYNKLRKEFGMSYDEDELRTGYPNIYAHLRERN